MDEVGRCVVVEVPERRDRLDGRMLHLRVVVLRATGQATPKGAIVVLPGGPGDGVTDAAPAWAKRLAPARAESDIVLLDPRGTGASGALTCSLDGQSGRLSDYFHDFMPLDRVESCAKELSKRADLTAYTTDAIADDLEAVRKVLGYPVLDLYGVSGGTRQAQTYLERYPDRVRSLVLAGTLGPGFRMPLSYARDGQAAFDSVAVACERDPACHERFPSVRNDLDTTLSRLARKSAQVDVVTPSGRHDTVVITRDIFAERVRSLLYSTTSAASLPLLLHRATAGDFGPFVQTVVPGNKPPDPDNIAAGHFLSITCSEDVDRIRPDEVASATANTFLGDYRVRQQRSACERWPHARLPESHFLQRTSTVPTLFILGGADPVTPPRWATALAERLPNSAALLFPQGGHVPIATACAIRTTAAFIDNPIPARLDVRCGFDLSRPPFVL
jgi:pimeloyl-ACP methyl ester carboxylesterase